MVVPICVTVVVSPLGKFIKVSLTVENESNMDKLQHTWCVASVSINQECGATILATKGVKEIVPAK